LLGTLTESSQKSETAPLLSSSSSSSTSSPSIPIPASSQPINTNEHYISLGTRPQKIEWWEALWLGLKGGLPLDPVPPLPQHINETNYDELAEARTKAINAANKLVKLTPDWRVGVLLASMVLMGGLALALMRRQDPKTGSNTEDNDLISKVIATTDINTANLVTAIAAFIVFVAGGLYQLTKNLQAEVNANNQEWFSSAIKANSKLKKVLEPEGTIIDLTNKHEKSAKAVVEGVKSLYNQKEDLDKQLQETIEEKEKLQQQLTRSLAKIEQLENTNKQQQRELAEKDELIIKLQTKLTEVDLLRQRNLSLVRENQELKSKVGFN